MLKTRLQKELAEARKGRDRTRVLLLSTTLSELRNQEIAEGGELSEEQVLEVLGRAIKRRQEAAEQMRSGGRPELAASEEAEAEILRRYLPPALTPEEIHDLIAGIIAEGVHQPGPVMGRLAPLIRGRFDSREAHRLVREALSR